MRKRLDNIIIHVGTNDLNGVEPPKEISARIINLATKCSQNSTVLVSSIIARGDMLNGKAEAVNDILRASCLSRNIGFIDHLNITSEDLNNSKLHLNKAGDKKLSYNFINFISKI